MNELLEFAVKAHGGIKRWEQFTSVHARVKIGGALLNLKGTPRVLDDCLIEANTYKQYMVITRFSAVNRRSVFTPERVAVEDISTGEILMSRENPRDSFPGNVQAQWDILHTVYFFSYGIWGYLTAPFLYTNPRFITEELSPWQENGETWRRLKIIFPDDIATHSREQISYFGEDGLLRRHDYNVDVSGGASAGAAAANFAFDYQEFNGIMVPTRRRVYPRQDNHMIPEPLLITLDFSEVSFT